MKNGVKKTVSAVLLSLAVLGTTAFAFPASAAEKNVQASEEECKHPYTVEAGIEDEVYTNAGPSGHQRQYVQVYKCGVCKIVTQKITVRVSEPHTQVPGTMYCVCGYYLH